jgi:hypothetical protein
MKLARHLGPLLALAVGIPTATGLATPSAFSRCSLVRGFFPATGPNAALFLAVPTPDTLFAGPGGMELGQGGGHFGNGQRDRIHGQRFLLVAAAGAGVADLAEGANEVALVPWDYDASCRTVPWARTARWLLTQDTVLIRATRRARSDWAGGIPTFDVTAVPQGVYSGERWQALGERGPYTPPVDSAAPLLRVNSPEELFEFLRLVPPAAAVQLGDETVLDTVQAWAFRHDSIARHEPARSMLTRLRVSVRAARLVQIPAPMRGTWRLQILLRSGLELTQWMRTAERPFAAKDAAWSDELPGPTGYKLNFSFASGRSPIPASAWVPGTWYLTIETSATANARAWRFGMELDELIRSHPDIPELKALQDEWVERMRPLWSAGKAFDQLLGEIALTPDGGAVLRIGWDSDGDGVDDVVVRGERVSMEVEPSAEASRGLPN